MYTDNETNPSEQCLCKRLTCSITKVFAGSIFKDIGKFRNADSEVLVAFQKCLAPQLPPRHKFWHFCRNTDHKAQGCGAEECHFTVQICRVDFQEKIETNTDWWPWDSRFQSGEATVTPWAAFLHLFFCFILHLLN